MARAQTRTKVHEAVLDLAAEGRVGSITMEGVAARAGISKQTLYRSWSSTSAVLFEALLARSTDETGAVAVPSTGDLARDLEHLATAMIDELTDPTREPLLRAVTADIQLDESLAVQYRDLLLRPQLAAVADRMRHSGVVEPEDVAELFLGAIVHRGLLRSRPFDPEWVTAHVRRTLGAASSDHRPA
jgi:AcrR family transcriptional regulator